VVGATWNEVVEFASTLDLTVAHRSNLFDFLATVCKMVRPVLSDRCLSVPSVTLVYCVQTVGWIKTKLGIHVGLCPGHIVLDARI